jgi:hypothetical protein
MTKIFDTCLPCKVVLNLATNDRIKDLEQKVTQERNVAITFCVENPTACKN